MTQPVLNDEQLSHAIHELLASNTAGRYARKARELANTFGLHIRLTDNSEAWDRAVERAEELWERVLEADKRRPAEIELALLLVALSEGSGSRVSSLLKRVAMSTRRTATWLGALARRLMSDRPGSLEGLEWGAQRAGSQAPEDTESQSASENVGQDDVKDPSGSTEMSDESKLILPG